MSSEKIKIIVGFIPLIPLVLAVPHSLVDSSLSADTKVMSLTNKERNSQTSQSVKGLKPKTIIVISVATSQRSLIKPKERIESKISKGGFGWSRSCLKEEKTFKDREEAEEYLKCLLDERKVLEGDFYGINITAYRYINIFYFRGYIRQKIFQIDREIKRTKSAILDLER
jgi:hypothetical protein